MRVRPLIALLLTAALSPLSENPADWLRVAEIGLSVVILVSLVELLFRYRTAFRHAPTSARLAPVIVYLISLSTGLWVIAGTTATIHFLSQHPPVVDVVTVLAFLAQPFTLAWEMLFMRELQQEGERGR